MVPIRMWQTERGRVVSYLTGEYRCYVCTSTRVE